MFTQKFSLTALYEVSCSSLLLSLLVVQDGTDRTALRYCLFSDFDWEGANRLLLGRLDEHHID